MVPLSVLHNWADEFNTFSPRLRVLQYKGTKDERAEIREEVLKNKAAKQMNFDVVLTTYECCNNDIEFFKNFTWSYLVVDLFLDNAKDFVSWFDPAKSKDPRKKQESLDELNDIIKP
ncbi:hypothetical protein HK102_000930 [Quaeritorhiza haematococci]|nr:hypothetical protein HK102_000930 [Quaeritorhiza haematococci]